jgi:hypothetical protein
MPRRTFLKFGVSGLALSMVQGASLAQSQSTAGANAGYAKDTDARLGVVVIGVDGADLTAPYLDDYLSVGATVWQYSENTIDFDRFGVTMPHCRNCLALGVFGIMALAGSARADAGEQDEPLSPAITRIMDRPQYANARWAC